MIACNRARANARKVRRQSQRESCQNYASSITSSTPTTRVWNKIRKIKGNYNSNPISVLTNNSTTISDIPAIADTLAEFFSKTSSSANYAPEFQLVKNKAERSSLSFTSSNEEGYNSPLTMLELQTALFHSRNSAAGPDGLHYIMFRNLSRNSLCSILSLFNRIWTTHVFPAKWYHAFVLPFPKPGKDPTIPSSYRPIALTSCLCKLLEKIISARLMYHLESNSLLSPFQSGFRKFRSTIDNILSLETDIREAFLRKHTVAVFFDIQKAYDMTWRYGILQDLHRMNLRGNLPIFISNFLKNRSFQVRLRSFYSSTFIQEQGVPQGSVLSVLLFIIKLNDITNHLNHGVQCSLYVDDLQISFSSQCLNVAVRQLQTTINRLNCWAQQNGFAFSAGKTVVVPFSRKRGLFPDPELRLGNVPIQVVEETRFLGIIFDKKLRFHSHIQDLRMRCLKALNILKVLSTTSWGADRTALLRLYRALIRSKIDYGSVVYGSACVSLLRLLDPVHHQALRLCLGAFRTSPVASLYAEAYEPSLDQRRKHLSLSHFIKIRSLRHNPAFNFMFDFSLDRLIINRSSRVYIPPFHFRVRELLRQMNITLGKIAQSTIAPFPPWEWISLNVDLSLSYYQKTSTPDYVYRALFQAHREEFHDFVPIFTDGSKSDCHVGAAAVCNQTFICDVLPDHASSYTAELHAIRIALEHLQRSNTHRFFIYSDSLSVLHTLVSYHTSTHPIFIDICTELSHCFKRGYDVRFCWLPGHAGIPGNEKADVLARSATGNPSRFPVPFLDLKALFRQELRSMWQSNWNDQLGNKLHSIMPLITPRRVSYLNRQEEVLISRLRIGHTRFTHRHILLGEQAPLCTHCNVPYTVHHIICICPSFDLQRNDIFNRTNFKLSDVLSYETDLKRILKFIKIIGFMHHV